MGDRVAIAWTGSILAGPSWTKFIGVSGGWTPHLHHGMQLVLGLERPVRWWAESEGWRSAPGVIIRPGVRHAFDPANGEVVVLYFSLISRIGRAAQQACPGSCAALTGGRARELRAALVELPGQVDTQELANCLSTKRELAWVDPRMSALLDALHRDRDIPTSLAQVARLMRLSPSRTAHIFGATLGVGVRPYLRFIRMVRGLYAVVSGVRITEAAIDAGFSDLAHFDRTVRMHTASTPSRMAGCVRMQMIRPNPAYSHA